MVFLAGKVKSFTESKVKSMGIEFLVSFHSVFRLVTAGTSVFVLSRDWSVKGRLY